MVRWLDVLHWLQALTFFNLPTTLRTPSVFKNESNLKRLLDLCIIVFWFQWRTFMTKWMLLWHLKYHFLSLLQQLHFYRCCYFRRSVFSYPLYPNTCCQQYHCHYFTDPYPTWGYLQFWCYCDISFFYVYLKSVFQFRIIFIHWFDWLIIS